MNDQISPWFRRLSTIAITAVSALSCTSVSQASPDYDKIGKQFSILLQNGHFSRTGFSSEMYKKFFEHYLDTLDPSRLYLTQEDVDKLRDKYQSSFGDYLLAEETSTLAEELHSYFNERALARITKTEEAVRAMKGTLPDFNENRKIPRSRKDVAWAKDDAALDQVWNDQVTDMLLSEVLRRESIVKLAIEQGKDPNSVNKNELPVDEKILARLKRLRNTIQETDSQEMTSTLLSSVASVYDPHSSYMGAREQQRFIEMMKAELIGIGAQLQADDDGSTKITGIVKGGPAQKSNQLKLGDRIIAVDRHNTGQWVDILFMSLDKVIEHIRGKDGEELRMRVLDADSGAEKIVTMKRAKIPMNDEFANGKIIIKQAEDMNGNMREYRLGILTLPSFYLDLSQGTSSCADDVKAILTRMIKEGVEGIIIDLRMNGGGSLEEVRKIAGYFTGSGPIVQVKDSRGNIDRLTVSGKPLFNGDIIVLTNKLSASASEIFAGAMVDYGRAVIVGDETTYGKGTVQVTRNIGDYLSYFSPREGSGMLKITIQKYYRIGGASTQLKGVPSDIVLPVATAAFKIGESETDYPLPYDEIAKAPGYTRSEQLDKVIPVLRDRSAVRVGADPDMKYMRENILRFREKDLQNAISLNKSEREKENDTLLARKKVIDEDKKVRYAAMAEDDKQNIKAYRLTLENVKKPELELVKNSKEDDYIDREETPEDELAKSPDYPTDLDPELRESLHILRDMIDLTK